MTFASPQTAAERDVGLRSYMLGIYNYMFFGLLVSGVAAYYAQASGFTAYMVSQPILFVGLLLAPFALIIAMAFAGRMSTQGMFLLYTAFTLIEGITLSAVLARYTGGSVLLTFTATSAVFAGLSLYGYTTKRDLQFLSTFFIGALFGLIAMMILNMFIRSSGFDLLIAGAGVLLFAGLIAFDTQKLKGEYHERAFIGGGMQKAMIWGALDLYLDFLNMFLFLLRFLGVSKDD